MKLRIGKRNIKTAIAVFLSVLISKSLKLEYPFFTVIAAIFSMENSISSTYKAGLYRIIGTLIGAVIGIAFIYIQPGNAILMGLGTIALIFICNAFNWDRAVPIAGVMFAAIMLSLNNKNPIQYSFSRVLNTFIGIVVAVIVNYTVFPQNNLKQIRQNLDNITLEISKVLIAFLCSREGVDLGNLRIEIINTIKTLETYKEEFKPKKSPELLAVNNDLESLRDILSNMRTISEFGTEFSLNTENKEKLKRLYLCEVKKCDYTENHQNIIFNYHISRILNEFSRLKGIG